MRVCANCRLAPHTGFSVQTWHADDLHGFLPALMSVRDVRQARPVRPRRDPLSHVPFCAGCRVPGTLDASVNIPCPRGGTDAATPDSRAGPSSSWPAESGGMFRQCPAARAYPATNEKLVETARCNGSNQGTVSRVTDLPAKNDYGPTAVSRENPRRRQMPS